MISTRHSLFIVLPLLHHAWFATLSVYQLRPWGHFVRTLLISGSSFVFGSVALYLASSDGGKVMDEFQVYGAYGLAGVGLVFCAIFIFHLIGAPFHIHYEKLRGICPSAWLHHLEEQDARSIKDRVHVIYAVPTLNMRVQPLARLEFFFRVVNASVYVIRLDSISGRPKFHDLKLHRDFVLSVPALKVPGKEIKHGEVGDIHFDLHVDHDVAEIIRNAILREQSGEQSGRFVFMNNCPVSVRCSPGGAKQIVLFNPVSLELARLYQPTNSS